MGYDDAGLCSYTTPKLTSVAQHVTEKAEMAAEKLLEWLKTGKDGTINCHGCRNHGTAIRSILDLIMSVKLSCCFLVVFCSGSISIFSSFAPDIHIFL
ncbi:MAG: hypothetical protein QM683_08195 [Lacrimispora sp.]